MPEVKKRLKALKADLTRRGIRSPQVTPFPALPRKRIEALEKKHGIRLPGELRDYYAEVNGQHIAWTLPGTGVVAQSTVMDLPSMLTGRVPAYRDGAIRNDAPFYSQYLDADRKRELEGYWVFERLYSGSFVLIPRSAAEEGVSLFLLEYPDTLTRLELSFAEYLEGLFASRGILNWQQAHKEGGPDAALLERYRRDLAVVEGGPERPRKTVGAGPYTERLEALVGRIRSDRRLQLVQLDRHSPPPLNAFRKVEATFRCELPQALVDFYTELNGFKLVWRTRPGVEPASMGVLDIPPLERAFGGEHFMLAIDWDDFVTYPELWNDETRDAAPDDFLALRNKRIFDRHLGRSQLLMEPTGNRVDFYYFVDGGVSRVSAGVEEVLRLAFGTAGTEYYPELLAAGEAGFLADLREKVRIVNPEF